MRFGFFGGVVLAVIGFFVVSFFGGLGQGYSEGFRVGYVQKVSRKGIWCHGVEGELVLPGFGSRVTIPGQLSQTWTFSSSNPKIMEDLERAAATGKQVKLTYSQWLVQPWCQFTDYEVIKVEVTQ